MPPVGEPKVTNFVNYNCCLSVTSNDVSPWCLYPQVQTKSLSECVEFYYLWKKKLSLSTKTSTSLTVSLPNTNVRNKKSFFFNDLNQKGYHSCSGPFSISELLKWTAVTQKSFHSPKLYGQTNDCLPLVCKVQFLNSNFNILWTLWSH